MSAVHPPSSESVLAPGHTYASVTDKILGLVLRRPTPLWLTCLALSAALLALLGIAITWLLYRGVGIWGINIPVAWGFAITNFVWWIGIGHAGTFISAFLLLLKQEWRTSINRFAEAMTIFAVMCAGMFPLLHLGRPWFFYWLLPYPNVMWLWPQFRSPLVWDVFAVSTYFTISVVFWYVGLIPDLAALRDGTTRWGRRVVYGTLALGWRGSAAHWQRYHKAYMLLAGLAAPLVISVHSVVGMDFSGGIVPGWHSTIFPPYFVGGAIFSGFAMVVTLAVPLRYFFGLQDFITIKHLSNCAKLMIVTGSIVAYGYMMEAFMAWYSDDRYEAYMMADRALGHYGWAFWCLIACNVCTPQLYWIRRVRETPWITFLLSLVIQFGMWMERFVIVVQSLHRDYPPSKWEMYYPTVWDVATLLGSIGLFCTLFYLFVRYFPVIAVSELRELVKEKAPEGSAPVGV